MTNPALIVTTLLLLVYTCAACQRAQPPTTPSESGATPTLASRAAAVPQPSATPISSPTQPSPTPEPPAPLSPPDGASGTVHELIWAWERPLAHDEWFELQIWQDAEGAAPRAYAWSRELQYTVTSSKLLPGDYRWRVVVVRGHGLPQSDELTPPGEDWSFQLARPSTVAKVGPVQPTQPELPNPPAETPAATPTTGSVTTPETPTATETPAQPAPTASVAADLPPEN